MPGPAARLTDPTAHGGVITGPGCPTVLIGGMPAVRVGDMQACPLVNPAPVPPPHATGPVGPPGVPTVLIGGMPAATLGDMTICAGPPGTIAMGCPTVLIGTGGGGGGSASAGGGAAAAAIAGGISAVAGEPGPQSEGPHWFDIQFVDSAGLPVTEVPYKLTPPDGSAAKGVLTGDGHIRRGGLADQGNFTVNLYSVYNAKWSKDSARMGDPVVLSAQTMGFENGTTAVFSIFKRDMHGGDELVSELKSEVQGDKIKADWTYDFDPQQDPSDPQRQNYSYPDYYFFVHVEEQKARSGLLLYQDWIEIRLLDHQHKPVPNKKYKLYLASGEIRKGRLDGNGYKKEEKIPPGNCRVEFEDL